MSECRTPATALASGRQGSAAQRQLAMRPADPPQLHPGPARGRRRAQGSIPGRAPDRRVECGGAAPSVAAIVSRPGLAAPARGRPRSTSPALAPAWSGGARRRSRTWWGGAGAAIASWASLRHLDGASLAPGYRPLERRNQPPICEFEIRFHTGPAAMRLPRHAGQPRTWRDEPGLGSDASLRGHCRIDHKSLGRISNVSGNKLPSCRDIS